MGDSIRAYVNGRGIDIAAGSSAIDAVRAYDAQTADQVISGERALTDSRGLPLDPSSVISGGSIVRIVSGRRKGAAAE
jgi:hypothetical protein